MEWIAADNPPKYIEDSMESETVLVLINGCKKRSGKYRYGEWYYYTGVFMMEPARGPYKITHWASLPELPSA